MASTASVWSKLCKSCTENIQYAFPASSPRFKWFSEKPQYDAEGFHLLHEYPISHSEVVSGSEYGCTLCTLVLKPSGGCLETGNRWIKWFIRCHDLHKDTCYYGTLPDISQMQIMCLKNVTEEHFSFQLTFDVRAAAGDPASKFISTREFTTDYATREIFQTAQYWVEQCNRYHDKCQRPKNQPMPTRVLDLRLEDQSLIKLEITDGRVGCYVALSYCWGSPQKQATTMKSLAQRCAVFSLATLPQTIKDAVTVTRELSVKFLWVDSICIVQDCDEDKSREITRMYSIYKNAYLTLVAARADAVDEGFLRYRPPPNVDLKVPYGVNEEYHGILLLREECELFRGMYGSPDATERRAWCLQEGILSHRCLIYSRFSLNWSCQVTPLSHNVAGSRLARSVLDGWHHVPLRKPEVFFSGRSGDTLLEDDWIEIWHFWRRVIEAFTRRKISDPKDRLAAVNGVAMEVKALSKGQHLAGIWEQDLVQELLWLSYRYSGDEDVGPLHHHDVICPSWLWASVSGAVQFLGFTKMVSDFELIGSYMHESSPRIAKGSITVKGRLRYALLVYETSFDGERRAFISQMAEEPAGYFYSRKEPYHELYDGYEENYKTLLKRSLADALPDLRERDRAVSSVGCLRMVMDTNTYSEEKPITWGLVLKPAKEEDAFQRVGLFKTIAKDMLHAVSKTRFCRTSFLPASR